MRRQGEDAGMDGDLLQSLRHPLRRRILFVAATHDRTSPKALADRLREPLSNVSYHVRVLADHGALTLVDTEPVRGSVRHDYRFSVTASWALAALGLPTAVPAEDGGA